MYCVFGVILVPFCVSNAINCTQEVVLYSSNRGSEEEDSIVTEYIHQCHNYSGQWCYVEFRREPPHRPRYAPSVYFTCAFNVSAEHFCSSERCARVDQNTWRCCCDTGDHCNKEDNEVIHKIIDLYVSDFDHTASPTSITPRSGVQCIDSAGVSSECVMCVVLEHKNGTVSQGCDTNHICESGIDACGQKDDQSVCCCNTHNCNSLCLLDTRMSHVQCVESVEAPSTSSPVLLFILIGVLLFLIILLISLQLVKARIRKRRSQKTKKLVLQATQHWIKNIQPTEKSTNSPIVTSQNTPTTQGGSQ